MMSKKYVPDGVWLTCDKGTCMSQLKITFHERTTIYGSNLATEGDRWPLCEYQTDGYVYDDTVQLSSDSGTVA